MPLKPGQIVELDIEVWPTCIILPEEFTISIDIRGRDFERPGEDASPVFPSKGSGPWYHDHPMDRPKEIFGGTTALYTGGKYQSYLLVPVIPAKN